MIMGVYLFVHCWVIVCSTSPSDLERARRKAPPGHLVGIDSVDAIAKLNYAIQKRYVHARPCEDFAVSQLLDLQRQLHSMSDPELELIYQATADNRRMAAFGAQTDQMESLEALWDQRVNILAAHPELHNITRDTLCTETAKWIAHHIPTEALSMANLDAPLLAVRTHDTPPDATQGPLGRVVDAYKATMAFQSCHGNVPAPVPVKKLRPSVAPSHPLAWPVTFEAHLIEARDSGNVSGMHFYDSTSMHELIKRDTGKYDQLCGTSTGYPTNSSCANLATSGKRYVFWPEEKRCCLCCTDQNGCGAVNNEWTKSAQYQGQRNFNGRLCDMWLILGGQKNFYYQDAHSGLPVAVQMTNQLADLGETFIWKSESAKFNEPVQPSVFNVPEYCKGAEEQLCPGWCAMLRKQAKQAKTGTAFV